MAIPTRLLLLLWALLPLVAAGEVILPRGWKRPAPLPRSTCNEPGLDRFHATADFDGDGHVDEAMLLSRKNGRGLALWIWRGESEPKLIQLFPDATDGAHELGLGRWEPVPAKTACGKGYWACAPGEPAVLKLRQPALLLFTCESASQVVYWNVRSGDFRRVWMSD